MGLISDLLRSARERERRISRAREAISALTLEEKAAVLAEALEQLGPKLERSRGLRGQFKPRAPDPKSDPRNFSDLAEEFVCARTDGSTLSEIAAGIGQARTSANATLHRIAKSRGTVAKRSDGKWHPTGKTPLTPIKSTRERITEALAAHAPMNVAGIHAAVERTSPGVATKEAIAAEIERMRAEGLVATRGKAAFALATGGAT